MPDLSLNIVGSNLAADAIKGVVGNIKGMGDAAAQFTANSVKMYAESQRAVAQLERVAGDSTDAFVEMATELQNTLGVSDDMVIGLQKLTLTFGAAQTQVEPTTRAILDYAAATGKDATQAMEMLIRGVDGGTGEIKKLGISFETTGDRTKDLAAATEQLAKKYGGAAAADADSLAGRARIAQAAMEDLQKSFGGLITDFIAGSGAVEKVTFAVKELQYAMSAEKADLDAVNKRTEKRIELLKEQTLIQQALKAGIATDVPGSVSEEGARARLAQIREQIAALDAEAGARAAKMGAGLSGVGSGDLTTGAKSAQQEAAKSAASAYAKDMQEAAVANARAAAQAVTDAQVDGEKAGAAELAAVRAQADTEAAAALAQVHIAQRLAMSQQQDAIQKSEEEFWTDFGRTTAKGVREAREGQVKNELDATEEMFANAGMQIGLALANEIASAMEEMLSGGEVDAGEVFGDIVATILAVAGTAIGAVVGNAGGAAVGGAIGSLAGSAVRSATRRRKRHDGGWSDAEEFHGGGWPGLSTEEIPAVLQAGERVLSRQEVGRMGGRGGVDAAARGGGRPAVNVNISSIDTKGVREAFSGEAGRGFQESILSGRGDMARLFGAELVY